MKLIYKIGCLVIVLCAAFSCRKTEVMPEPVGEKIPYNETQRLVSEQLKFMPNSTLFLSAWQKSGIDSLLNANDVGVSTVFAPSDAAMQQAGWTKEKIVASSRASMAQLISIHVVLNETLPADLNDKKNTLLETVREVGETAGPRGTFSRSIGSFMYRYLGIYAQTDGSTLSLFGMPYGKLSDAVKCQNGIIYPLDKVIEEPVQTIYEYLQSKPEFSMYLEAVRINDSLYTEAANYDSGFEAFKSESIYKGETSDLGQNASSTSFTLFVPTNKAFKSQGFNNTEDIRAFALRNQPLEATYDPDWNPIYPLTALDSLMGKNNLSYQKQYDMYDNSYYPDLYFINDFLKNQTDYFGLKVLKNFSFTTGYYAKYEFSGQAGTVKVKSAESNLQPVPILNPASNIRVKNAVIHVLDEALLMP